MTQRKVFALLIVIAVSSPLVFAQCYRVDDRIGGGCAETGCIDFCALPQRVEAMNLMPGFFTAYQDGKSTIVGTRNIRPHSSTSDSGRLGL